MIEIIFESHGSTFDNEDHKAAGQFDVDLSELGKEQAKRLGERHKNEKLEDLVSAKFKWQPGWEYVLK